MSKAATTRREGSRLEIDSPYHCKWCGGELPRQMVDGPICGGDSEFPAVELCGSCKATQYQEAANRDLWYVTLRAWGEPYDNPDDGYREYAVTARRAERAKKKAVARDKDSRSGVINQLGTDGWEIVEVSGPR